MNFMNLPDFLITPSILIQDKKIQPLDREVYAIIYWIVCLKVEICDLTNAQFAEILNSNPNSISRCLKHLWQGGYIAIEKNVVTNQRSNITPLVMLRGTPNGQGLNQMVNPIIYNNNILTNRSNINIINNKKELLEKKEKQEISLEESSSDLDSSDIEQKISSKTSIVPLTDLERWEMATELDVPLHIVKMTDRNFWNYIEDPKNRKKYKTSYKVIKRWIQMKLDRGEYENCNEVEKLELQSQHPDRLKEVQEVFSWWEEEERKKEEAKKK